MPESTNTWLIETTKQMVAGKDQSISYSAEPAGSGAQRIKFSQIPESSIDKLEFPVNSERSNNILSIESFSVYLGYNNKPLNIPGLSEVVGKMYKKSETAAYILGNITHRPFVQSSTTIEADYDNFNEFISKLSKLLPDVPDLQTIGSTTSQKKFYEVIFLVK